MRTPARDAVYARYVRTQRWLNVAVAGWLVGVALLVAGWLVSAAMLRTGLHLFSTVFALP